ncbi:hypothetical protein T484DRAFT_1777064, partial [Baffinella frigidus]
PSGGVVLEGAVEALYPSGELLYVGGRFQRLGGRVLSGLAVFNSTDTSWNAAISADSAIVAHGEFLLYQKREAGSFSR